MPAAFTSRWLARLPRVFLAYDVDGVVAGFLDAFGIEGQAVADLVAAIDKKYPDEPGYVPGDTSALVDPATAPAEWLQWVAMIYGVQLDRAGGPLSFAGTYGQLSIDHPTYANLDAAFGTYADQLAGTTPAGIGYTEAQQRAIIADRPSWRAGSTATVVEAIQELLIGSRLVAVTRSYGGNWATVRVATYTAETPYPWQIAALIARPDFVAAHVLLTYATLDGGSYADVDAAVVSYADETVKWPTYEAMRTWVPGT